MAWITLWQSAASSSTCTHHPHRFVQDILKVGNKTLQTVANPNVRVVDDVCKTAQEKCKSLLPKMKELRAAGLFAYIHFTLNAKIIYKQGDEWKTIFP